MESSTSLICVTWKPFIWRILKLGMQVVLTTCHCVNEEDFEACSTITVAT